MNYKFSQNQPGVDRTGTLDFSDIASVALPQSTFSSTVTGPTGSFAQLNVTTAEISATAGTGGTAVFTAATVGGAAGGPTTTTQNGWMQVNIQGTKVWVPVWQ